MRKFVIEISFDNIPATEVYVRALKPRDALKKAIDDVSRDYRENIIGTKITSILNNY